MESVDVDLADIYGDDEAGVSNRHRSRLLLRRLDDPAGEWSNEALLARLRDPQAWGWASRTDGGLIGCCRFTSGVINLWCSPKADGTYTYSIEGTPNF